MRKPSDKVPWKAPELLPLPPLTDLTLQTAPLAVTENERPALFSFVRKA